MEAVRSMSEEAEVADDLPGLGFARYFVTLCYLSINQAAKQVIL